MSGSGGVDSRSAETRSDAVPRSSDDHHQRLWWRLTECVEEVVDGLGGSGDDIAARQRLADYAGGEIRAHLETERAVLYAAARNAGEHSLADVLEPEHRAALDVIAEIEQATTSTEAALGGHSLRVLFALRMQQEEEVVIPALRRAGVDTDALLDTMMVQMASDYESRFRYF